MQEALPSRPPVSGMHQPLQMPTSSSCSYNSYPIVHHPVATGNNIQPMDGNLYGKAYNLRPPYPSSSNQFSYLPPDQQVRPQREVAPPAYYERPRFGQSEGGQFYGDQDVRPPRHELTDNWGYSRPPFPSKATKFLYLFFFIYFTNDVVKHYLLYFQALVYPLNDNFCPIK